MRLQLLFAFIVSALLNASCYGIGTREPIPPTVKPQSFSAKKGEENFVSPGDAFFVHGLAQYRQGLEMSSGISSTMPGAYWLPFDFSIEQCELVAYFQTQDHEYFAAPFAKCDARHSLLGNVLRPGDTVGVRIHRKTKELEWYVDNSNHNRSDTVWYRDVRERDGVLFERSEIPKVTDLTQIGYDGFYSNLLHFTLTEIVDGESRERVFTFDIAEEGSTQISIKGNVFEVVSADNLGMNYRWIETSP
jgi:hypothetical protein